MIIKYSLQIFRARLSRGNIQQRKIILKVVSFGSLIKIRTDGFGLHYPHLMGVRYGQR